MGCWAEEASAGGSPCGMDRLASSETSCPDPRVAVGRLILLWPAPAGVALETVPTLDAWLSDSAGNYGVKAFSCLAGRKPLQKHQQYALRAAPKKGKMFAMPKQTQTHRCVLVMKQGPSRCGPNLFICRMLTFTLSLQLGTSGLNYIA